MNAIQKKRLLNVAKALRDAAAVPELRELFYMGQWGYAACDAGERIEHPEIHSRGVTFKEARSCGTPACALGHYAARRDLQREFVLETSGAVDSLTSNSLIEASVSHFGVEREDFETLFGGFGCNGATTPKAAAQFIERFVARQD